MADHLQQRGGEQRRPHVAARVNRADKTFSLFHTRYGILEKRARRAERAPSTLHAPRGSLHSVDVKRRRRAQLLAAIEVDVDELTAGEEL